MESTSTSYEALLHGPAPDPISSEQWRVYSTAVAELRRSSIPFAIGGGIAIGAYTGRWRNTKDLDIYVTPDYRQTAITAISRAGLKDYYDVLAYDRAWIYRSHTGDVIVDVIWAMANHKRQVDQDWIQRGPHYDIRGESVRLLPPEELLWAKLYVLQRERCDWGDALNLVYSLGPELDWRWLKLRLDDDEPLLEALLRVFAWLCPEKAARLPAWLFKCPPRSEFELPQENVTEIRATLLDTRPWFGAPAPNGNNSNP
ncbi:MAG TPA: nucleotidyltransferase [Bryobacteraceae bacterium]|nr:nucleotidyltransferase [Bryobacteraceae bacterium]